MKKIFKNAMWFVNGIICGLLIALAGIWGYCLLADMALAATYNVFFNNVEQGANSTATPTVQISGNKPVPAPAPSEVPAAPVTDVSPVQPASVTPASAQNTGVNTSTMAAADLHRDNESTDFHGRVSFLANSLMAPGETISGNPIGGMVSASFFPLRDFGVSVMGGGGSGHPAFYGGEVEFLPLHLGLFGLDRFVNAGFVAGATTIGKGEHFGTVHGGLVSELNLGNRFALTAGLRTNLTDRNLSHYLMADAGVSVRF